MEVKGESEIDAASANKSRAERAQELVRNLFLKLITFESKVRRNALPAQKFSNLG